MPDTRSSEPDIGSRKDDHLTLAAREESLHAGGTGLRRFRLRHRALPGRDLAAVDLATSFLGARLDAPLLVSAMTGGTERARVVNERLAAAASAHGLGFGLGSGRALLADMDLLRTYRTPARPPLLLANLGAVQFRLGLTPVDAERLVDLLQADGLVLHLNPVQEAVQPGGDTQFEGLVEAIASVVARLAPRPVVVKEVGFGLDPRDVALLVSAGVAAVDVAGAGGTNWASVEGGRDPRAASVAEAFRDWGWPTALAIREAVAVARPAGVPVVGSGGVTDGVEAAIALALGASVAGIARTFLIAALDDRADAVMATVVEQLRIAVWAVGLAAPGELASEHLIEPGDLL